MTYRIQLNLISLVEFAARLLGINFSAIFATSVSLVRMIFHPLPASLESRSSVLMWTVPHPSTQSGTISYPSAGEISPGMCQSGFELFHKLYTLETTSEFTNHRILSNQKPGSILKNVCPMSIKLGVLVGWVGHHHQVLISRFPLVRFFRTGFTLFGLARPND